MLYFVFEHGAPGLLHACVCMYVNQSSGLLVRPMHPITCMVCWISSETEIHTVCWCHPLNCLKVFLILLSTADWCGLALSDLPSAYYFIICCLAIYIYRNISKCMYLFSGPNDRWYISTELSQCILFSTELMLTETVECLLLIVLPMLHWVDDKPTGESTWWIIVL